MTRSEVEKLTRENETMRSQNTQLNARVDSLKKENNRINAEADDLQDHVEVLKTSKEELGKARENASNYESESRELRSKVCGLVYIFYSTAYT